MHELIKEIERQLEMDRIEEGNMSAEDVLYIVKGFKRPYLNENQQIVLNWLKEEMKKENMFPISCLWELQSWHAPKNVCSAYLSLDKDRQFQLLSAFIEWFEQEEK